MGSALRKTGSTSQWRKIRERILIRDGYICQWCGVDEATHVDHIVPRSKGGGDFDDNLVASCKKCNLARGNKGVGFFNSAQTLQTPRVLFLPENASVSHYQAT